MNGGTSAAACPRVSIVVISYNTRELTRACLRSVQRQARGADYELLVVDNASSDGSAEAIAREFPDVRLDALDQNLGFAAANNRAAKTARGTWLLLLNPDTVVLDHAVDRLVDFAEAHPEAGIFGGRTYFADGSLNPTSCWNRPTPWSMFCLGTGLTSVLRGWSWFNPEAMPGWQRDIAREVDIVTGCFFLLRRDLWEQLGGFDPAFFMYAEEADLCLRARNRGVRCLICPQAQIIHYGGASEKVRADKLVRLLRAKAQLLRRHWSPAPAAFGVWMLSCWALTRMTSLGALSLLAGRYRERWQTWRDVWRSRTAWTRPAETARVST